MATVPGVDDIGAMQAQGDFKDFLRLHLGITEPTPRPAEPDEIAPAELSRRPGAWPVGTRPPTAQVAGTPQEWQRAVDAYRAWNVAGQPRGDFACDCGCTPRGSQ